jgi:CRP-like cAMP-binding protein
VLAVDEATSDRLRSLPLFAGLSEASLARVREVATVFEAPAGSVLVEVGQPGSGLFILEEGSVVVELPGGGEVELGPGEFVGDMALLTDDLHSARVRTRAGVRCLAISRRDFAGLLDEEPRIAVAMLPVLARRLRDSL